MRLIAESILDESMPNLNAKIQYIRETEKKIEDISVEIDNLTTALSKLQVGFWLVSSFSYLLISDLDLVLLWVGSKFVEDLRCNRLIFSDSNGRDWPGPCGLRSLSISNELGMGSRYGVPPEMLYLQLLRQMFCFIWLGLQNIFYY